MSHGGYQQYGGNPYEGGDGYGASSNPYGQTGDAGYGASNPYGGAQPQTMAPPAPPHHQTSNYSQGSQYSEMPMSGQPPSQQPHVLSNSDFLTRVDGCKSRIRQLTTQITDISTIHQRLLSDAAETGAHAQLEHLATQTQNLNMQIKDEIKLLEKDAARSGGNVTKDSQVRQLKNSFGAEIQSYQRVEQEYRERYRDQIKRQIRIVNPEASEQEVNEAADSDWGSEGIFQTALKSNRSQHANSVLGAVRARHNDIQRIEKTMGDLALLMGQMNEAVVMQEPQIDAGEHYTQTALDDSKNANTQLDKGIENIKRRNRLRRWTLFIFILIICIIALVLGLYFGLNSKKNNNSSGSTTTTTS